MNKILFFILLIFSTIVSSSDVILNINNSTENLEGYELRMIFTGKIKQWNNFINIRLVLLPLNSFETKSFILTNLGMPVNRYRDIINNQKNFQKKFEPIFISNEKDMIKEVSSYPGAIGYINQSKVILNDGVKVIFINL
jgi:ABC-type phosphate transport system substrate-binding protein